jgi:hypothetical protein
MDLTELKSILHPPPVIGVVVNQAGWDEIVAEFSQFDQEEIKNSDRLMSYGMPVWGGIEIVRIQSQHQKFVPFTNKVTMYKYIEVLESGCQ